MQFGRKMTGIAAGGGGGDGGPDSDDNEPWPPNDRKLGKHFGAGPRQGERGRAVDRMPKWWRRVP